MRLLLLLLFITSVTRLFLVNFLSLGAYQPPEAGLFYAHSQVIPPTYGYKTVSPGWEKRANGSESKVMSLNSIEQFQKHVLQGSFTRPIILKICTEVSVDSQKIKPIFQDLADSFSLIGFVALDALAQCQGQPENSQIIASLMQFENLEKVDLPILFFFKDGGLYKAEQAPAALLQGFYTKENLENIIRAMFFQPAGQQNVPDQNFFDITVTGTDKQAELLPSGIPRQWKKTDKNWWQQFKQLFKTNGE